MNARIVTPVVAVAFSALLALAGPVHADGWPTPPPLPANHPVPGWAYELTYETDSGKVISVVAYDPAGPPFYGARDGRTASVANPGQAIMDVSKHPQLTGIMGDVDAYFVDAGSGDVKRRSGYSGPSSATPGASSALPLEYLPPLLLGIAVGAALLTRVRLKR